MQDVITALEQGEQQYSPYIPFIEDLPNLRELLIPYIQFQNCFVFRDIFDTIGSDEPRNYFTFSPSACKRGVVIMSWKEGKDTMIVLNVSPSHTREVDCSDRITILFHNGLEETEDGTTVDAPTGDSSLVGGGQGNIRNSDADDSAPVVRRRVRFEDAEAEEGSFESADSSVWPQDAIYTQCDSESSLDNEDYDCPQEDSPGTEVVPATRNPGNSAVGRSSVEEHLPPRTQHPVYQTPSPLPMSRRHYLTQTSRVTGDHTLPLPTADNIPEPVIPPPCTNSYTNTSTDTSTNWFLTINLCSSSATKGSRT